MFIALIPHMEYVDVQVSELLIVMCVRVRVCVRVYIAAWHGGRRGMRAIMQNAQHMVAGDANEVFLQESPPTPPWWC
jgi:hypothetical protein